MRRHLGHAGHDTPDGGLVRLEPAPEVRPPRVLEEGEGQVGLEHGVADLGGVELHVHREGALLGRLVRPLRPLAGLLEASHGGQRLGPRDESQVEIAGGDVARHLRRQHVGHRPANARIAASPR